jgi:hypothetical protein
MAAPQVVAGQHVRELSVMCGVKLVGRADASAQRQLVMTSPACCCAVAWWLCAGWCAHLREEICVGGVCHAPAQQQHLADSQLHQEGTAHARRQQQWQQQQQRAEAWRVSGAVR